jgi:hypothetical protein
MTFTYNIQKVDFFTDQVEEMGQVDLDGAIEAFQKFPFNDQLKEAQKRELTSCLPTITFKSNENKTLGIWAKDDKGFFLHYDNGTEVADFYLSNDFEKNPEGFAVEEFIEQFIKDTIEQSLSLVDKNIEEGNLSKPRRKHSEKTVTFSFSDTNKLKPFLWIVPYLSLALLLLLTDLTHKFVFGWSVHLILGFLWFPGIIVHISYWFKNHNSTVTIDPKAKTIEYRKNGQSIKFNRNDIFNCELNVSRGFWPPWNSYCYLWIVLKDHKQIVITNFITDPETIINSLKLNFKTDRRSIPFLPI